MGLVVRRTVCQPAVFYAAVCICVCVCVSFYWNSISSFFAVDRIYFTVISFRLTESPSALSFWLCLFACLCTLPKSFPFPSFLPCSPKLNRQIIFSRLMRLCACVCIWVWVCVSLQFVSLFLPFFLNCSIFLSLCPIDQFLAIFLSLLFSFLNPSIIVCMSVRLAHCCCCRFYTPALLHYPIWHSQLWLITWQAGKQAGWLGSRWVLPVNQSIAHLSSSPYSLFLSQCQFFSLLLTPMITHLPTLVRQKVERTLPLTFTPTSTSAWSPLSVCLCSHLIQFSIKCCCCWCCLRHRFLHATAVEFFWIGLLPL